MNSLPSRIKTMLITRNFGCSCALLSPLILLRQLADTILAQVVDSGRLLVHADTATQYCTWPYPCLCRWPSLPSGASPVPTSHPSSLGFDGLADECTAPTRRR